MIQLKLVLLETSVTFLDVDTDVPVMNATFCDVMVTVQSYVSVSTTSVGFNLRVVW